MLDLSAYPKSVTLKNNRKVRIAPLKEEDRDAAMAFLSRLPHDEQEYLSDDPHDPSVIRGWTQPVSANKLIPLAVWEDHRIVSVWTLGFGDHGWTRHLGYIWGIVELDVRRSGLGTVIVRELLTLAAQLDMERVVLELVRPQKGPISHFTNVGFTTAASLKDWVKDRNGRYHDLIVLTMELEPAWRKMEEMLSKYDSQGS